MVNYPPEYVPIQQNRFEFEWLLEIFKLRKPKRILEVGTAHGGTLWAWSHNCESGATIVAVDRYVPQFDNRKAFASWQENGASIIAIQGDSYDPAVLDRARSIGPYEWLFIDADHHYEAVMQDWCNYVPMVIPGGIIAFHDITPNGLQDVQVCRLWEQIKKDGWRTISIFDNSNAPYCGIGVVFKR